VADRQDSDREVLTSLPRTRPVRRSAKRGDRADVKAGTASTPSRRAAATKPKAAKPAPKPRAAAVKAKRPATAAAKPKTSERPATAPRRKVPPAGYAAPTSHEHEGGAGTADLLSTTIQAAAELAQIGLTVGRQTLQSMIDRLPKP